MGAKLLEYWQLLERHSNVCQLVHIAIKIFLISPSEICDERTASHLGWFNAAQHSSMSPETLVECTKLYDFYTNSLEERDFDHKAHIYVPKITPTTAALNITPPAHQYTAPSLANLLNKDNISPLDINGHLEASWFDAEDPYDLEETAWVDAQNLDDEHIVRCSTQWKIGDLVKLDSTSLTALITHLRGDKTVGIKGGEVEAQVLALTSSGHPDDWKMEDFI
ncbi:hypothetical protein H0H87_001441 [Tephrocybe sp. NHM501043]|nr:hypothetical protein H0H87_001441 [Tephrocybe sp. NHM501043]